LFSVSARLDDNDNLMAGCEFNDTTLHMCPL